MHRIALTRFTRFTRLTRLTHLTIACALLVVSGPAAAQVYKWTDENGKVHYGDKPQGAKPATKIATPATGTQPAGTAASSSLDDCHTITCQGMRAEQQKRAAQKEESKRAQSAGTQQRSTPSSGPSAAERERAAAVRLALVDRGVDCDKPGAINQWVQQDRPMTAEQQRAAVAARNAREAAARRY
jgi:Domain of unknown function (DUF4124)